MGGAGHEDTWRMEVRFDVLFKCSKLSVKSQKLQRTECLPLIVTFQIPVATRCLSFQTRSVLAENKLKTEAVPVR